MSEHTVVDLIRIGALSALPAAGVTEIGKQMIRHVAEDRWLWNGGLRLLAIALGGAGGWFLGHSPDAVFAGFGGGLFATAVYAAGKRIIRAWVPK